MHYINSHLQLLVLQYIIHVPETDTGGCNTIVRSTYQYSLNLDCRALVCISSQLKEQPLAVPCSVFGPHMHTYSEQYTFPVSSYPELCSCHLICLCVGVTLHAHCVTVSLSEPLFCFSPLTGSGGCNRQT